MVAMWSRFLEWLDAVLPATKPEDDEHERPFRMRLFNPGTLAPQLRLLTATVLAQVVVVLVLLALRTVPALGPQFAIEQLGMSLPRWNFLAAGMATIFGVSLVTVGLATAHWTGRLIFLVLLIAMYAIEISIFFSSFIKTLMFYFVFISMFIGTLAVGVLSSNKKRYSPERQHPWIMRLLVVFLVAPYVALLFGVPIFFSEYLILLRLPLVIFFFVAGTDWAEMTDEGLRGLLRPLQNATASAWLGVAIAASLSAVALVIYPAWTATAFLRMSSDNGRPIWEAVTMTSCAAQLAGASAWADVAGCSLQMAAIPQMLCDVLLASAILVTLRLARFRGNWPDRIPWAALVVAIAFLSISGDIVSKFGHLMSLQVVQLTICVLAAGALITFGRRPRLRGLAPVALYLMVVSGINCSALLPGGNPDIGPYKGLQLAIGLASFAASLALYRRRSRVVDVTNAMRLIAILNFAIIFLFALIAVAYPWMQETAERQSIAEGFIVFVALLWEVLISGHAITNVDGRFFPRKSRLLLFLGYISLVVATVVFWGSLTGNSELIETTKMMADSELFVKVGIAEFGPAIVITLFVLRFGRWFFQRLPPTLGITEIYARAQASQ